MAKVWKQFAIVSQCLLCVLLLGCGAKPEKRFAVSGKVNLDGQPLSDGMITFTPVGKGLSAGAPIQSGAYSIPETLGPSEGKFKVAVNSRKPTGKQIKGRDGASVPETADVVAPQYNVKSDLTTDIAAGKSEHNFDVKSAEIKKVDAKAKKKG